MATLHIEPTVPLLTPAASLTGWRREFCVELLGDAAARIFVRAVEEGSHRAAELKRGVLFRRLHGFSGSIRPSSAPAFIVSQLMGALIAFGLIRLFYPHPILIPTPTPATRTTRDAT